VLVLKKKGKWRRWTPCKKVIFFEGIDNHCNIKKPFGPEGAGMECAMFRRRSTGGIINVFWRFFRIFATPNLKTSGYVFYV
jgi:hypothetical protein